MKNACAWVASVALLLPASHAIGDGWSSFQNGGQPVTEDARQPPVSWDPNSVAWQAELVGYGQSTPVTSEDAVFVTAVAGENKEELIVQCLALTTGAERWQYKLSNSSPEKNNNYVSRAAPTPVCDDAGVVAFFEGGNVVALTKLGELRWQRDLVADYGPVTARHGLAASLEQNDRLAFVWVERQEAPYVLALDKATGETVWKSPGLGASSWSSPRLAPVGESTHLVLSGIGTVGGYDPENGERLWTLEGVVGNSAPTPAPLGAGRILLGATTGRGESGSGAAAESNGVVEVTATDDGGFAANYVWRAERATTSFGSPIAHQGNAYFVNRSGVVYCLDLESGEERFAKRGVGSVWATPIGVGPHVYLFGKDGKTAIIQAGPRYEVVSTNELPATASDPNEGAATSSLGGPVLYAAALAEGRLLLRRGDRLYCITGDAE